MITLRLLNDEVAPVDGADPADEVNGGEQLSDPYAQLRLVDVGIAEASADHSTHSWEKDVQHKANVGVNDSNLRSVCYELPDAQVRCINRNQTLSGFVTIRLHVFLGDA